MRRRAGAERTGARLLLPWLLAAACAHAPVVVRPYPPPSAEALVQSVLARQRAVRSLNGRARATSWLGGERVRATVNLLVERDGHLRFEAEVSLQGMVATLATDGVRFALLDARKNELSRGPACPANVASLVRIPLDPADVAAVLLGDVRLPAEAAQVGGAQAQAGSPVPRLDWDPGRGADLLGLRAPDGGELRLFFRGQGAERVLVGVVRIGADGGRRWQTSYEDFDAAGGASFPRLIRFAEGNGSFDDGVEIRFKDRTLNGPAPAEAFTLAAPPGMAVKEVGCGGP